MILLFSDENLCQEICVKILLEESKLEMAEENQIKLFIHLFKKNSEKNPENLKNLVRVLLYTVVATLKKSPNVKNVSKLKFLSEKLILAIKNLKLKNDFTFGEINQKIRNLFFRISLQSGLKITKNAEKNMSFMIKAVTETCDIAFEDGKHDAYVKDIFDMVVSQVDFINIILSNDKVKGLSSPESIYINTF